MCSLCFHSPHLPGCPNGPEEKPVAWCDCCGKEIYAGERLYTANSEGCEEICEDCLEDLVATDEELEFEGYTLGE